MISIGQYLYARWDVVALCVAMGIVFGLEMLGICGRPYLTLTAIIRTALPPWVRAMVLGWLWYHFLFNGK